MRVDKPAEGWFANGADSQVKAANLDALVKDYYTESSNFSNLPKYNYWIEEWGYVDSADAVFKLDGGLFHVECQTSRMSSMRFRMLEYDIAIAIAEARRDGGAKLVFLPRSIVVCTAGSAADLEIGLMSGRGSEPDVSPSVVECRAYGIDEMVSKGLYLLVPFYLVRYERRMRRPGGPTASARSAYLQDCARLSDAMTSVLAKEGDELCNEVMQLTVRCPTTYYAAKTNWPGKRGLPWEERSWSFSARRWNAAATRTAKRAAGRTAARTAKRAAKYG